MAEPRPSTSRESRLHCQFTSAVGGGRFGVRSCTVKYDMVVVKIRHRRAGAEADTPPPGDDVRDVQLLISSPALRNPSSRWSMSSSGKFQTA